MADPYVILAPLVEPPLPPWPVSAAPDSAPWWLLGGAIAIVLLVAALYARWRRAAPARALRRIARLSDARQGAHALAQWQRQHGCALPPAWQQALERLRFGAPGPQDWHTLQRLCAEAAAAALARKGRTR